MVYKIALILSLLFVWPAAYAQVNIQIQITSQTRENLDLQAIAYLFGQCQSLEEFEYQLNNPDNQFSNLDLNRDGYIDYIRVVEVANYGQHIIYLQDVISSNRYKNLARIVIQRDQYGNSTIQIIGNESIYGRNYVLYPSYQSTPYLLRVVWQTNYRRWTSPYYWNHYPSVYHKSHQRTTSHYQEHISYQRSNYNSNQNRGNSAPHYNNNPDGAHKNSYYESRKGKNTNNNSSYSRDQDYQIQRIGSKQNQSSSKSEKKPTQTSQKPQSQRVEQNKQKTIHNNKNNQQNAKQQQIKTQARRVTKQNSPLKAKTTPQARRTTNTVKTTTNKQPKVQRQKTIKRQQVKKTTPVVRKKTTTTETEK